MRVKIVSDGTPTGTRLVDAETGKTIRGVRKITWGSGYPGDVPTATVEFISVPIEVTAELDGELIETTAIDSVFRTYERSGRADA